MKTCLTLFFLLIISICYGQKEKVILHHDKPYYFSGEEIDFSIHLISPSIGSDNTYAELVYIKLIDKDDKIISEGSVLTKGKSAYGSLAVDSLQPTGYYEIVAFTNRLRNLGESGFFRKRIPIFNEVTESNDSIKVGVDVVVEGGKLVDGISNRVAIHSTDMYGRGVSANIVLMENEQVLKSIRSDVYGLGTFYFKPNLGSDYKILVDSLNITASNFPAVEKAGTALQVRYLKQAVQIILQSNEEYQKQVNIVVKSGPLTLYKEQKAINKTNPVAFNLDKGTLPSGVLDVIVLNQNGQILNTRSFMPPINDLTNVDLEIKKSRINPADSLNLTVYSNSDGLVTFSVLDSVYSTVYQADPLAELLFDAQLLDKCVRASISVSSLESTAFDNLLLFRNSPEFPVKPSFESENYQHLKGILTDTKPLPKESKILFFVEGINATYETTTDSTGRFSFPILFEFYGPEQIIFSPLHDNHKFEDPKIKPAINVKSKLNLETPLLVDSSIISQAEEQQHLDNIYRSYSHFKEPSKTRNPFLIENIFTKYDIDIDMKEYLSFETMETVIKEIMPGVQLRDSKGERTLRIYSKEAKRSFEESPLIFIDNKPTFDIEQLLDIDPYNIKSIKVVGSLEEFQKIGSFAENGVIVVKLKSNNGANTNNNNSYMASGLLNMKDVMPTPDFRDVLSCEYLYIEDNRTHDLKILSSYRPSTYSIIVKVISDHFAKTISEKVVVSQ